jgi:aromatic-L-amino-acid decarboxylase
LARLFASWIDGDSGFELAAPAPVNLVCFRHIGGDDANQRIMDRVNRSGEIYLNHTKLNGELTLRMSIGQTHTEERHVRKAWELIREASG